MPTPEQIDDRPRFDSRKLPTPSNEYICWLDVMGTQASLTQSLHRSANFFAKIHLAALEANSPDITLYPVMDGIYVSSKKKSAIMEFLRKFFRMHAIMFCAERDPLHRFLVRGGLSFGPVVHGRDIATECADFGEHTSYRNSLLLGMPMIQSFQSEQTAPPFGVFVHESARSFAESDAMPIPCRWYNWWNAEDMPLIAELRVALPSYFNWALKHSRSIDYPNEKILEHAAAAKEYFDIPDE